MRQNLINSIYIILKNLKDKEFNNGYSYLIDVIPEDFNQSGLYFFFDPAVIRNNGQFKIIRIGITGANENNRLLRHKNGPFGGSVFREHIGRALNQLNNQNFDEHSISDYINKLPYIFLPINNQDELKLLERRCIQIVSNKNQDMQIDVPLDNWLGYQVGANINLNISKSHLWNVHHTGGYNENENYENAINLLSQYVENLDH